jgi:hypothetical protein
MSGRDAAGGGLITWAYRIAAKKWPFPAMPDVAVAAGHIQRKMVRIGPWRSAFCDLAGGLTGGWIAAS